MGMKERARNVRSTSITSAIFLFIFAICAIIYFGANTFDGGYSQLNVDGWFLVGGTSLFTGLVCSLVGSIMILGTN